METTKINEILHRIKNTLLGLRFILEVPKRDITPENARQRLIEAQSRLDIISSIYEMLYEDGKFINKPDLRCYLYKILSLTLKSLNREELNKQIFIKKFEVNLNIETTLIIGLVFNEFLCNSIKYSMKSSADIIEIDIFNIKDRIYKFLYSDNGSSFELNNYKEGTGTQIIKGLLTEIDGDYSLHNGSGWHIHLIFNEKKYKEQ